MRNLFILLVLITSLVGPNSWAGGDDMVLIQGQIGNAFDKTQVKVIDSHDQTYYLPKSVFPKDFDFTKPGKPFTVEVNEKVFDSLDIKPASKVK